MSLKDIYVNEIGSFIRSGEYDPSDKALTLVWKYLVSKHGAAEVLSEAINGDELLSQDILNLVIYKDAGDQGKVRINNALCDFARYYVDRDEPLLWEIWESRGQRDPMDLAKESRYIDDIAGGLKGIF